MIRADWHLAELTEAEDPFEAVTYTAGIPIDLGGSEEELAKTFVELLKMEDRLARNGLTCELKDGGQNCLQCSVATLDRQDRRSRLCRLGKDEANVEARCNAITADRRHGVMELVALADEASELGHLDEGLAELLTAAGL